LKPSIQVQGVIVFVYKQTTFGYSISQRPKKKSISFWGGKKKKKKPIFLFVFKVFLHEWFLGFAISVFFFFWDYGLNYNTKRVKKK
jgi:hypothetical protein